MNVSEDCGVGFSYTYIVLCWNVITAFSESLFSMYILAALAFSRIIDRLCK